jgi:ribosomal protein S6
LNKYEGMLIFPESMKDNVLEEALGRVRGEIKKLDGEVESTTRLGKRAFARRMHKQEAGHYAILTFTLPEQNITPLLARCKLNEELLRVQIVRAEERPAVEPRAKPAAAEGKAHGVA